MCAMLAVLLVSGSLTASADDVVLTEAQADSITVYIDELELEVGFLRAELDAERAIAAVDSTLAADRLALFRRQYEETLDLYKKDRPGWLERLVMDPKLWLVVGVWAGTQAN